MLKYGDKKDYPKIDIYLNGVYTSSTTWARNIKEAINRYKLTNGCQFSFCDLSAEYHICPIDNQKKYKA